MAPKCVVFACVPHICWLGILIIIVAGCVKPARDDGAVGSGHVAARCLHFPPCAYISWKLRPSWRPPPEVTGGPHVANDGLMLGFQCWSLGRHGGAMGIDIAELMVNRHATLP